MTESKLPPWEAAFRDRRVRADRRFLLKVATSLRSAFVSPSGISSVHAVQPRRRSQNACPACVWRTNINVQG